MEFQLGTEKSLDGIANYFIRFGLCLKTSQSNSSRVLVIIWFANLINPFMVYNKRPVNGI